MEFIYPDESYQILGVLFEINKEIGYGHREKYYQKAIAAHFDFLTIPYKK